MDACLCTSQMVLAQTPMGPPKPLGWHAATLQHSPYTSVSVPGMTICDEQNSQDQ